MFSRFGSDPESNDIRLRSSLRVDPGLNGIKTEMSPRQSFDQLTLDLPR